MECKKKNYNKIDSRHAYDVYQILNYMLLVYFLYVERQTQNIVYYSHTYKHTINDVK